MTYSAAAILTLASQCAPSVAPETVLAIIQTESSGEPFALNVNGGRQPAPQSTAADAAATAQRYVAAGYSVDLGLGQINSRNMRWLGLTWENVFDPCTNVAALARVLTSNYNAVKAGRDPQAALRVALSMYNTGNQTRGFRNGYVAKVVGNAGVADAGVSYAPILPTAAVATPASGDLREMLTSENTAPQAPAEKPRPAPPPSGTSLNALPTTTKLKFSPEPRGAAYEYYPESRAWRWHLAGKLGRQINAMPKSRQSAILWGVALAAATIISVATPDPAYAQNLESFASKVRGLLSSTLLRTLAVIAVIVTGLLWFTGRASTAVLVTVIIGIAIVFSADSIVGIIAG